LTSPSELHPEPDVIAAVDLGSNSFHLAIARYVDGALTVVDRLQERVQLAAGLDADRALEEDAQARAVACLERFGQRLRDMHASTVRAVGTDTLRVAKNARDFIDRASAALGHPIEVVSGEEEARLIYRGVVHDLPHEDGKRQLVMDIGGGSTEVILGAGLEPDHLSSLRMGCVNFSQRFFSDGRITRERLRDATIAARLELERLRGPYFRADWARTLGSSGTINAIQTVLRDNGWTRDAITAPALKKLREALAKAGHVDRLAGLSGLKPGRAGVFSGGVAILHAAFKTLPLVEMRAASGAMREGVMYDLLGRFAREDVRETTIRTLMERFRVDHDQALRVERAALELLERVAARWFPGDEERRRAARLLSWSARLHELGQAIAFHGYHRHGAYVVQHATMPGFSNDEQAALAALVLIHRRKLHRPEVDALPRGQAGNIQRIAILLRLAFRLNRNRSWRSLPDVSLEVEGREVTVAFPEGFLDENPLTRADFEDESSRLRAAGYTLTIR